MIDFKGMQGVNRLLQGAGAFYIRRSFGQDVLYWTAVSEYIQHHITHFQAPMQFFLEGTRSRVGKSLTPKSGHNFINGISQKSYYSCRNKF